MSQSKSAPTPNSTPTGQTSHSNATLDLLKHRRFLPLFLSQFLGAFNDNLLKSGFSFLLIYHWSDHVPLAPEIVVNLAAALLIMPFLLFSAYAGRLADSIDKAHLARIIKAAEIAIMALAIVAFHERNTYLMLVVIFLMGSQSTFFGPIKYALLPLHLRKNELLDGNAFIESSTFMAILLGTLSGGIFALMPQAGDIMSYTIMSCAVCGWLASLFIPAAPPPPNKSSHESGVHLQQPILRMIKEIPSLWTRILFISWFWFFGALLLAQLPAFVKDHLLFSQESATLLLLMLTLGITFGSFLCRFLLTLATPYRIITYASLVMGIAFFGVTIAPSLGLRSLSLSAVLVFIAATCGGLYSVPLYTQLQRLCPPHMLSRCIAVNNIVNAAFIVTSAGLAIAILKSGGGVDDIFLMNACVPLLVGLYLWGKGKEAIP